VHPRTVLFDFGRDYIRWYLVMVSYSALGRPVILLTWNVLRIRCFVSGCMHSWQEQWSLFQSASVKISSTLCREPLPATHRSQKNGLMHRYVRTRGRILMNRAILTSLRGFCPQEIPRCGKNATHYWHLCAKELAHSHWSISLRSMKS
jgi:hypothetical protein